VSGRGQTFVVGSGLALGVREDPSRSQPTVVVEVRQAAPAPSNPRKRRRVNSELIPQPYTKLESTFKQAAVGRRRVLERVSGDMTRIA
jgi:hypothetical protein